MSETKPPVLTDELRAILKRMWDLAGKMEKGYKLTDDELDFYRKNISVIAEYYKTNHEYWFKCLHGDSMITEVRYGPREKMQIEKQLR